MVDVHGDTLEILKFLAKANSTVKYAELMHTFDNDYKQRLRILISNKYIKPAAFDVDDGIATGVVITAQGKDYIALLEQKASEVLKKEAEDKAKIQEDRDRTDKWNRRNARRQWAIAIIGFISSIATFVIGILVDNNAPIKQWLLSVFK